jgi:hypothetical protein
LDVFDDTAFSIEAAAAAAAAAVAVPFDMKL